eukprot:gnl/MRDRNA2_/MRDRNA2_25092_c0_seq1.p1 gnl/MRDRNA2_/MRDRNA2_25092_c0~~gnl/MRDRNA2_/MRDRNA2_25092_c0_seq1.p1  ORF type:complete len:368 (+),score=55.32 gnl/MRDRNA2_/MRDRNA2_25092_c0_seq1:104-1207(+)
MGSSLLHIINLVLHVRAVSASSLEFSQEHPCINPLSSKMLSEAVDAALVSLHGQNGWLSSLRKTTGYAHPMEVTSCTPKAGMWSWPSAANADGLLANVLHTGRLRVAGVKWKNGGAADYQTNPEAPTGFWPEYMHAIVNAISSHYGTPISVHRVYYANSDLVNQAVANGTDVDMSEPYYYLGGFHDSKPRIESLHTSCITVATVTVFFSSKASGIKSMDELYQKVVQGPNRKVGFIGAGNYDSVSHVLPANIEPIYITDSAVLEERVNDGTLLAAWISEASASDTTNYVVYETGVISPRVALFRQDSTKDCVHGSATTSSIERQVSIPDSSSHFMLALMILASVVFFATIFTTNVRILFSDPRIAAP